ncbi:Phox homologous domain-containing protein [Powellomyces hirtus]|nr:Phox homologous domain-containing protein [Powellomyces hirtus]
MTEPVTSVQVPSLTHETAPHPHITYTIQLKGPFRSWTVHKRYSEFTALHKDLQNELGSEPTMQLPPKHFSLFGHSTLTDPVKIEERRRGLESYLRGILYSGDTKWRRSHAWLKFLGIAEPPSKGSGNEKAALSPQVFTPAAWMTEFQALKALTRDLRAHITTRDRCNAAGDVQGAQSAAVAGKQGLRALEGRLAGLEKGLGDDRQVAKGELMRRQDLFGALVGEVEGVAKALSSSMLSASSSLAASSVTLTPQQSSERKALLGGSPAPSRRFGTATPPANPSSMEPQGLLQQQQLMMATQDDALTTLSSIIRRQKEIGVAIGQELDLQNGLLEEVDSQVDRVQGRLAGTSKKLDKVLRG